MEDKLVTSIDFKEHFQNFLNVTLCERERAERRRDYRDLKQWTQAEVSALEERQQAAVIFDQFSKKVDGIIGLEVKSRTDPKAYPVKPDYEKAAEAITDGLRFVESKTFFDDTATEVFEDKIVEGYGGAIVEVDKDTLEIEINQIHWDRIYFDPYSRRKDFKDAKYMGITLWLDLDEAIQINPEKKELIKNLVDTTQHLDETFGDKPRDWIDVKRKRVRINQEFYLDKKGWMEVYYCGDNIIIDPRLSPYQDQDGNPTNPIELESDFVDRDNNRWGYMQRLMDVQDEINHRRSKALHLLSTVTVYAERGAFGDQTPEQVLNEIRKGYSYIEYDIMPGGSRPEIDRQQELGQSQLAFYADAQNAMDSVGANPEMTGSTDNAISGVAFQRKQEGGMVDLARIFARHREWKTRIYRQIWCRMKQFWTDEKWIRVTNEDQAMRFVGLNIPITMSEKEIEQRTGLDIQEVRNKNPELVDQFIQRSIEENPMMGQVVETRNDVVKLNMDIIVQDAPDVFTLQQQQFETLATLAGSRIDPQMFKALLKLSTMQNKDEVLEMFEPDEQQQQAAAEQQQQEAQVNLAALQTNLENTQADTAKKQAEAQKTLSEIPLNKAKTKDELASAIERVGKTSGMI